MGTRSSTALPGAEMATGPRGVDVPGLVPVMQPRLPSSSEILPYLQSIDTSRWYSNGGPLVTELERRLGEYLRVDQPAVVTTANATAGITAALLALDIPAGSLCLMPSWTFVATPHAAMAAGLTPWFHDVDRATWALDPEQVAGTVASLCGAVGCVVVVSPFGAPLDIPGWEAFERQTGIPVVVDAAAGFDTVQAGRLTTVVSLHATKILGCGEGGFVVTTDAELRQRLLACCNFGFKDTRSALMPALNCKMSEYHAAVALAGLERWHFTRLAHLRIMEWYRAELAALREVQPQPGYGCGWVGSTTSVELPAGMSEEVASRLRQAGIDSRRWWGAGCHVQPAFSDCPHGPLPVTEDLGGRVLGLPHFPDMQEGDVKQVVGTLSEVLGGRGRSKGYA